jgi:hypothetical protein
MTGRRGLLDLAAGLLLMACGPLAAPASAELVRMRYPEGPAHGFLLLQQGPSFTETADISFDRSGKYRVRRRPAPDKDEESAEG